MDVDPILVDRGAIELATERTALVRRQTLSPPGSATHIGPVAGPRATPTPAPVVPVVPVVPAAPAALTGPAMEVLTAEANERDTFVETINAALKRVRDHLQRVSDEGLFAVVYRPAGAGEYAAQPGASYVELHEAHRQAIDFSRQVIRAVRLTVRGWGTATGPKGVRVTDADGRELAKVEWNPTDEALHQGDWVDATAFKADVVTRVEVKASTADEQLVLQSIILECRGYVAKPLGGSMARP